MAPKWSHLIVANLTLGLITLSQATVGPRQRRDEIINADQEKQNPRSQTQREYLVDRQGIQRSKNTRKLFDERL